MPENGEMNTFDVETSVKPVLPRLPFVVVSILALLLLTVAYFINPPQDFPIGQTIEIERGTSAADISIKIAEAEVVRSATVLYAVLVLLHDPSNIKAGAYVFDEPANVFAVADQLAESIPQAQLVSLTFPEGYTAAEYASIAALSLPQFDKESFIEATSDSEGYLFPDTYFVPTEFTALELSDLLKKSYSDKIGPLRDKIQSHSLLSEDEIIILASIVEREANTPESMKIVAGILLSRLEIGMPLQADASMEYVLEKPLEELTPADLKIDSPYNTYLYRGLPPTPIGNPGLTAIEAVLFPESTEYLYYITDETGEFHYARTLREHNINIDRYLR